MSGLQAKNAGLHWRAFKDEETYYPLRDGPRAYRAVWCVERMRRFLPPEQIAMATRLQAAYDSVSRCSNGVDLSRVDCSTRAGAMDWLWRASETIRELAGYEQAARVRVGNDGRLCYFGVIEGDGMIEMAVRLGYPVDRQKTRVNYPSRAVRRLVQITLEALQQYEDENQTAAQKWSHTP